MLIKTISKSSSWLPLLLAFTMQISPGLCNPVQEHCDINNLRKLLADSCDHFYRAILELRNSHRDVKRDTSQNEMLYSDLTESDSSDELSNNVITSSHHSSNNHDDKNYRFVRLRRRDFPINGYIVVERSMAQALVNLNEGYRILMTKSKEHKRLLQEIESQQFDNRVKRQNANTEIDATMCCRHKCQREQFCY